MDKDMWGEVVMMLPSIDLDRTARWLDSRTVSEVNGVKKLEVYDLVKANKVVYYRQATWDKCKFEDPDPRMVATKTLDYISVDHDGNMFYKFKDKIMENYKLRLCRLSVDPSGKVEFPQVQVDQCKFNYIFEDKFEEESQVDQWLDSISVDNKGEMY